MGDGCWGRNMGICLTLETFPDFLHSPALMLPPLVFLLALVQLLLPSFLHVPVPYPSQVCWLGDNSGIGIRIILPGPILFSQELKEVG